jgi:endonuclease/exonuclease/phosphatase family metal-dependent hydrolase
MEMVAFPEPQFEYAYDVEEEVSSLWDYRLNKLGRSIPPKSANRLLVATWNVANLGVQERREQDYAIIAELVSWFDLVAMQEVNDNLRGLRAIQRCLPNEFSVLFSDRAGNNERLAFIYDSTKVKLLEKVGEIGIPVASHRYIRLPGTEQRFRGFDRNPFLGAFEAGGFTFVLVNVHLYFGSDSTYSQNRRSLEAYAVGRWADLRRRSANAYSKDIIALGDFNLPSRNPGDPIYEALTNRGLHLPEHSNRIGSNLRSDKHYDQIAFFPGETGGDFMGKMGVFDFDGRLFRTLWDSRSREDFEAYMRYYISDHRILWAEFST